MQSGAIGGAGKVREGLCSWDLASFSQNSSGSSRMKSSTCSRDLSPGRPPAGTCGGTM